MKNYNPTPSSEVVIKSTSTFPNLFLEETNTLDNSIPESEIFRFNLEEISSGSPTTHSELCLPDYKAFYVDNDHFKEKSSGSTTTHVDFSKYDSFIFDLSNDQFPPADRSDFNHEEFADELAHIISPPEQGNCKGWSKFIQKAMALHLLHQSKDLVTMILLSKIAAGVAFCVENGIMMLKMVPETPLQFGVAERLSRTFRAESTGLRAEVPKMLWADSVSTSYLIYCIPYFPIGLRIPEEEWQGKDT
ncbi:hypothetical protein Tco_1177867, partial [Tanacetum coccineum]